MVPTEILIEELRRFAAAGRFGWAMGLPDVTKLLGLACVQEQREILGLAELEELRPSQRLEIFEAAVEASIERLAPPYRLCARCLFGFEDPPDMPPQKKGVREEHSAGALGHSDRWFRGPVRIHPYNGARPLDFVIGLVAQEMAEPLAIHGATTAVTPDPQRQRTTDDQPREKSAASPERLASSGQRRRLYSTVTADDLQKGFWWRESTDVYLGQLSNLGGLTIFGGADGPADVGPPLHVEVISALLQECLVTDPLMRRYVNEEKSERRDLDVAALARQLIEKVTPYGASSLWIGSMLTGLYQTRSSFSSEKTAAYLRQEMEAQSNETATIGFVCDAITEAAFAYSLRGTPVTVISDHYDDDLRRRANEIRGADQGCVYTEMQDIPREPQSSGEVPLIRLHEPSHPLIGEAEYVRGQAVSPGAGGNLTRGALLQAALSSGPTLFVGSSLMDPGLVYALAETIESRYPRYAILLAPPDMGIHHVYAGDGGPGELTSRHRQASLELALLGARYLHLGVIPILPDFRAQVPQFLRELAAKVRADTSGVPYDSYSVRVTRWWEDWKERLGFSQEPSEKSEEKQLSVFEVLESARKSLSAEAQDYGSPHGQEERIVIEAWIRNPEDRYLFRWASSEAIRKRGETATRASLDEAGDITQKVFREGRLLYEPVGDSEWKYCITTPIILEDERWNRIPIGALKILSSSDSGYIRSLVDDGRRTMKETVNMIVDDLRHLLGDAADG
jgi:hypothetical protein